MWTIPAVICGVCLALVTSAPAIDDAAPDNYVYDYSDYADYGATKDALPFTIFDDVEPRPPAPDVRLPSACAWAVVQCCANPDAMGSRIGCFSNVGCSGAWLQDFCKPETKQLVLKMVLQSFQLTHKK